MLANGPVVAVLRASARQKLSAGLLGSVLIYCLTREKNGGFDEATGLGRAPRSFLGAQISEIGGPEFVLLDRGWG